MKKHCFLSPIALSVLAFNGCENVKLMKEGAPVRKIIISFVNTLTVQIPNIDALTRNVIRIGNR